MICPKCLSTEIDSSGTCPVCGINASEATPPDRSKQEEKDSGSRSSPIEKEDTPPDGPKQEGKDSGNYSGLIEMDYSSPSEVKSLENPELPQWRRDLARRLQEIRQKREAGDSIMSAEGVPAPLPVHGTEQFAGAEKISVASSTASTALRTPRRTPKVVRSMPHPGVTESPERPKPTRPAEMPGDLPLFRSIGTGTRTPVEPSQTVPPKMPAPAEPDPKDIRGLIDSVIARKSGAASSVKVSQPSAVVEPSPPAPLEDRLIIVSRTLSGLVDLLVVVICTGAFIIATDMTSGIDIFDGRSLIIYSLLLCAVYFVYSIFFLATASQTVGMMLTNLKVVDSGEKRPRLPQILWRCSSYLASLLLLGAGLIWGCFDRQCRCLHDRLSDTHIVRL